MGFEDAAGGDETFRHLVLGKTMLSVALARAAAQAGHKVHFTTCEDMTRRLHRAAAEHRFAYGLRSFTSPGCWSSAYPGSSTARP